MASGIVKIADIIKPSIFDPYTRLMTEKKSRLIQSGAVVRSSFLDKFLEGGGKTTNVPSWKPLDDDTANVSTDDETIASVPNKIGTVSQIAVRCNRNQSWAAMDLTEALAGDDPVEAISAQVAGYWDRHYQYTLLAQMTGIFANNATATDSFHVQNDMTVDISGASYTLGVTTFSAEAMIDAQTLLGDSSEDFSMIMVHSIVYARMKKNNLIDFIPDSRGEVGFGTFLGRSIIIDDAMPNPSTGIYHSYLFGAGSVLLGTAPPKTPSAVERSESKGTGGGMETLFSRVQFAMHPRGFKFNDTSPDGGPSNAATSGNFGAAASWTRSFPERKMVKIARLITREA